MPPRSVGGRHRLLARWAWAGHDCIVVWSSTLLSKLPKVVHGFTGATGDSGQPLDLGTRAAPDAWEHATQGIGVPGWPVARLSQVHGTAVLVADEGGAIGEGDAAITRHRGLLLAVRTADCLPIALASDGVVGAVHAGWRGLAACVIQRALEALPRPVVAAVGPGICATCYEVGPEVVDAIARTVPRSVFVHSGPQKEHADLAAAAGWILRESGVEVDVLGVCTHCDRRLHSHRRDDERAGRQALLIGLRP